jgi:chitinase
MLQRSSRALAVLCVVLLGPALAACAPTPDPAATDHSLTGYWQNFDNGATNLRLGDVPAAYDIVAVAFADAVPGRRGAIAFNLDPTLASRLNGYTVDAFKADIARLHGQGRKVVLSVGGQNGQVYVDDAAAASAFADTTVGLMQTYGFDGVDIDLENAPNLQYMTSALRQIRDRAGAGFVLTMAPETLYVQPGGSYLRLIDEVDDLITVVNTQYYNSGAMLGRDGRIYNQGTVDFMTAQADILLDGHLRPDQVGLGLPASPSGAGSGYVSPGLVNDALSCLAYGTRCGSYRPAAQYPTIRGAMTWSINWDAANGYQFANTVGPFLDGMGGGGPGPTTTGPTTTGPTTTGPTTSTTRPGGCAGVVAWNPATAYWGGDVVAYNGHRWSAKWWTQGDVPGANAQDVWVDQGTC